VSIALVEAPSPFYSSPIKGEENGKGDSLDSCESRERKMGGATE